MCPISQFQLLCHSCPLTSMFWKHFETPKEGSYSQAIWKLRVSSGRREGLHMLCVLYKHAHVHIYTLIHTHPSHSLCSQLTANQDEMFRFSSSAFLFCFLCNFLTFSQFSLPLPPICRRQYSQSAHFKNANPMIVCDFPICKPSVSSLGP